jgi:hypothetical protein
LRTKQNPITLTIPKKLQATTTTGAAATEHLPEDDHHSVQWPLALKLHYYNFAHSSILPPVTNITGLISLTSSSFSS